MNHASLFSGIGGFDLAAQWLGWENVFHCEINPFGRKLLEYYWPNAISYDDITKTDFTVHRGEIDILTGGFPCQPFSVAGKRKGTDDDRNLWPEYHRAIKEIQPAWVVGENVPGIINWSKGLVFEQVQADLENEGYEVWTFVLPAAGVNAPHRRDRVWFVAYAPGNGHQPGRSGKSRSAQRESQSKEYQRQRIRDDNRRNGQQATTTNTKSPEQKSTRDSWARGIGFTDVCEFTPHADSERQQEYDNAGKSELQVWFNSIFSTHENWSRFPTQSPLCSRDDGFPAGLDGITFSKWRNESIKAYGNAIVPQVAIQIFKTIFYINNHYNINLHEKQQKKKNTNSPKTPKITPTHSNKIK